MNYNEYNEKINLPDGLYKKTLFSVKSAVSEHNQAQKRRKTVFLSTAACFAVLVCSVFSVKYLNKNSFYEATGTTVNNQTEKQNNSIIEIKSDTSKYPHKIIIGNKIYSQYYFGDEKGDTDNNIEIKQSEIGGFICEVDASNLTDNLTNFAPMSADEAKNNKFYKAKAYRFTTAKSDNIIIVQAKDEYYMFYLDGVTDDYTIEELLNVYTADGANEIVGIEVFQDGFENEDNFTSVNEEIWKGTIRNKAAIQSILSIIEKQQFETRGQKNYLSDYDKALKAFYSDDYKKGNQPLKSEYGIYTIKLKFSYGFEKISDETDLTIFIEKDSLCIAVCQKDNTVYFSLNNSDYNEIIKIIETEIL